MPNTLKIKRGTAATIPQGQLAEPLFTTDTYDLYIGKGSGGNQRIQKYITSGTSSQFLKGDGSLDSTSYQPSITLTTTGSSGASTFVSNTLNVPNYSLSGLGGEPAITPGTTSQYWRGDKSWQTLDTNVVPENGPIYFTEPRVLATVLTGLNLSGGGTIAATDSILTAFGKVQNQISALVGGVFYKGTWNASTNSPTLTSSIGTKGWYYIVTVAGSTNLDGITDWKVGDWAIFNGTTWDKVDNTDAVSSVNGFTGAVNLGLGDISNVTLTSPTNNQLIKFDGTTSKWINFTPAYEPTLTKGNLTESTSTVLTITGGTGAVIGSGTTIQVATASATQNGVVTTGTQTFAGIKTFSDEITLGESTGTPQTLINYPGSWKNTYKENPGVLYGFNLGTGNTETLFWIAEEGNNYQAMVLSDAAATENAWGISTSTDSGTNWYARLVVNQNGNVGIGKNNPSTLLDVAGAGTFSGALYGTSAEFSSTGKFGQAAGAVDTYITIGENRTATSPSYIDLIGDTTYNDYGFRMQRTQTGETGSNTTSLLIHRGTGNFILQANEAATIKLQTLSTDRLTIDGTSGAATFSSYATGVGFRATGSSAFGSTGVGAELGWTGSDAYVQAYNRTTSTYQPMTVAGSTVQLNTGGTDRLTIASTGAATFSSTLTSGVHTIKAPTGSAAPGAIALSMRDSGNTAYGFDFNLEGVATGDLYLMRTNNNVQSTVLQVSRATGAATFSGGTVSSPTLKIQSQTYPLLDFIVNDIDTNARNFRLASVYNAYGLFEILSSTTQGGSPTTSRFSISGINGLATFRGGSGLRIYESTNTNFWDYYTYTDNSLRFNYNGAGNDEIVITSGGNVGIGSTSPTGFTKTLKINVTNTTDTSGIILSDGENDRAGFYIDGGTTNPAYLFTNNSKPLVLSVAGAERMRISSTGATTFSSNVNDHSIKVQNSNTSGYSSIDLIDSAGTEKLILGWGNSGLSSLASKAFLYTTSGVDLNFYTGGSTTARMTITSGGNLGLGVTPSTSTYKNFQINTTGILGSANGYIWLGNNWVYNSGDKYIVNGTSQLFGLNDGGFQWFIAPSGTAGSAISFTQAMTITSSGIVGINTASPTSGFKLDVKGLVRFGNDANANVLQMGDLDANSTYIQSVSTTGTAKNLVFYNTAETMRISSGGEVYIAGTTDQGAYNLQCNGTGVWGAGAYVNGSDIALKENIKPILSGLSFVSKMNPVSYNYIESYSKDRSLQTGFIAQDLLEVFEGQEWIEGIVKKGNEYYNVAYQNLIPILTKAIQELKSELDILKNKN